MGKDFWEEAVVTSAYLCNRISTRTFRNNKTQKIDLNKIKVFGCYSYVHIPVEDRRNKLDPRSQKMYLVGYIKIVISARNVVFNEHVITNEDEIIENDILVCDDINRNEESNSQDNQENVQSKVENNTEKPKRQIKTPKRFTDYEMTLMKVSWHNL